MSPWKLIYDTLNLSHWFSTLAVYSVQFSLVTQFCPTLCDPMNCSTPGLPVHHQLPEFTQTHVHLVGDAIQPSHPLSSPFPCLPSFLASGSFPMSPFFASGGQSNGVSALASVSSVQFSHSVVSDSLRPHELQHARAPCLRPTPRVHSNSRLSSW